MNRKVVILLKRDPETELRAKTFLQRKDKGGVKEPVTPSYQRTDTQEGSHSSSKFKKDGDIPHVEVPIRRNLEGNKSLNKERNSSKILNEDGDGTPSGRTRKEKGKKVWVTPRNLCYFCQKTFQFPSKLEAHLRTHTLERPFLCHICPKDFSHSGHLVTHIKYHLNQKAYICNFCSKSFVEKCSLETHIRRHVKEKWFKCPQKDCPSSFTTPFELGQHTFVHSGEKPLKCNLCGKGFSRKDCLDIHIRYHLKEKPYTCNICRKGFVVKGHLDTHIRRHLNVKPFKCPEKDCTLSFAVGAELKSHSRIHSGEKPFACEYPNCGKFFRQKGTLNTHLRTHSGERPYKCPSARCGKTFTQSGPLLKHRRTCCNGESEKL